MFTFREMFTSLAPFFTAATVIVLSPFVKERIPYAVSNFLVSAFKIWLARFSTPQVTVVIEEKGNLDNTNHIYEAARAHLRTLISNSTKPRRFKVNKEDGHNESTIDIVADEEVIDIFNPIRLKWKLFDSSYDKCGYLELSFEKGFEREVLESYLPDIAVRYEKIQNEQKVVKKVVKLYSYNDEYDIKNWVHDSLEHPITFEKLAMDPEQKKMLKADLDTFRGRKDLYEDVGKTWKRGYLLYGPPGTGKSSLIAAMANYLEFSIYDLSLSGSLSEDTLRRRLRSTTNRSILVIEDIDCGADLDHHKRQRDSFMLSDLLNLIDGLWSSRGEERIIVFTTNDKDKLDPALLRPGRMDVHVHLSYCTIDMFKLLATNYLKIEGEHQRYREIEGLLKNVEVTPAEIAEQLLKSGGTDVVLRGVVKFLEQKERQKAKAAELKEFLKSTDIDVDAEGLVEFLKQKKLENAQVAKAEQLLNSGDTDVDIDVEGLIKFVKKKKIEDAKAAEEED